MPKPLQPNFVLDVEASELFIQAGLQDRVIQVIHCAVEPLLTNGTEDINTVEPLLTGHPKIHYLYPMWRLVTYLYNGEIWQIGLLLALMEFQY